MRDLLELDDLKGKKMESNREEAKGDLGKLRADLRIEIQRKKTCG